MSAATPKTYKYIRITDPREAVWVSPMDSYERHFKDAEVGNKYYNDGYIILIGATGSGKSSFIEAIASGSTREPLGIAKDQLESVTQEACIYEIKNLTDPYYHTIYIIDTPGFADPRISELQVLDKIAHWRDQSQNENYGFIRLVYFHPITDIRMPASRKQCLEMVKRCWGSRLLERAMLVTTMWDRVPERSRDTMDDRFAELSTNHWGDWITEDSPSVKFENTFDSAMEILNTLCYVKGAHDEFPQLSGLGMEGTIENPIYQSLLSRLSSLEQKRQSLSEDLAQPSTQGQTELISILTKDLAETELLLQKFTAEMDDLLKRFGSPLGGNTSSSAAVVPWVPSNTGSVVLPTNPYVAIDTLPARDEDGGADLTHIANEIGAVPTTAATVLSPAHPADTADPVTYVVDAAASIAAPLNAANTSSTRDRGPQQHASSLPKRFGQWTRKKLSKLHLRGLDRKGA